MATEQLNLCDRGVFLKGKAVALVKAEPNKVEDWVKLVAEKSRSSFPDCLDWHYTGPIAQVLFLGSEESRARVEKAIDELEPLMGNSILKRFAVNEPGIYRRSPRKVLEETFASRR